MNEIEKILNIALAEEGYLEKKSNSQLDSKTANAGKNNYTKYARDLDNISGFYNGKKQGYPWCDVFVDWCFVKAFGVDRAKELLCQPNNSLGAGATFSARYYKEKNQFFTNPQKGDQIFFKNYAHTGIVYKVDNNRVYTVEGNTNSSNGVIPNGGAVCLKSYPLNSPNIEGYGRPNYASIPEPVVPTKKEIVYQVWDNVKKKWLPIVSGKSDYAGNFGHSIGGLRAKLDGAVITITSHIKNGSWLSEVVKWDDTSSGYSGIKGKPIDMVMVKSNIGIVHYRVHLKNGNWLPWVTGYNKNVSTGYAGIKGKEIDAIQMYIEY